MIWKIRELMDYELYHDEKMVDGYWHGMLLVPVINKNKLIEQINKARKLLNCNIPLSFKIINKKGKNYNCANAWIQICVAALRSKTNNQPYPIFIGRYNKNHKLYENEKIDLIRAKFIVFRVRDFQSTMNSSDFGSKVETTFRMGLKGGLHFIGNFQEPINITKIHFDGHEHIHRNYNETKVIGKQDSYRQYCSFLKTTGLIDDRSSKPTATDHQSDDDMTLLQLTDLMIGSFRTALGFSDKEIHRSLALSIKPLLDRYNQGYARMQNSRWRNSFCISECFLDSGEWVFNAIKYKGDNLQQLSIF
jgi:hypothetical protein